MDEASHSGGVETAGRGHGGGLLRWVWIAGLALVLYALSIGPARKLVTIASELEEVIYFPIEALRQRSSLFRGYLTWYEVVVWQAYSADT